MTATRSSAEVWLVGKPTNVLSTARLPSQGDVLRMILYHHLEQHQEIKPSIRSTAEAVVNIWERGRIPTQRIDNVERKIRKLYDDYMSLKKNRTSHLDSYIVKVDVFQADFENLFDISTKNALELIKNEEDKTFLIMQREDPMSCSMAGVDQSLTVQETRKRSRDTKAQERRERSSAEMRVMTEQLPSSSVACDDNSSSTSSELDDDYAVPSSKSCNSESHSKKKKSRIVLSSDVTSSLDRVNISDRRALFVVGIVAQALGQSVEELSISRSTIRRARCRNRETVTAVDKAAFHSDDPLILHWDSKLLPDINSYSSKVDRVVILVSGGGKEKILAVPKIAAGTGEQQANACLQALDEWDVRCQVRGLVFDTTSSNTGIHSGACTLLERNLNLNLVWIGCRHHVFEVMLSSVFTAAFGASGGPEVGIFKRFQKQWSTIDQDVFIPGSDTLFSTPELLSLRAQLVVYYTEALNTKQTRDDYAELLNLCRIFLGETANVHFRAPGATHNARWMSKAIYCLKIYLFQHQFVLTQSEKKGVTAVSLFVSIIYGQFWNEAPVAEKAPLNDVKLLTRLESYPDEIIRDAASKAFKRHLWYLSEHLIGLSFFDPQIEADVKKAMANNLNRPAMASNLK